MRTSVPFLKMTDRNLTTQKKQVKRITFTLKYMYGAYKEPFLFKLFLICGVIYYKMLRRRYVDHTYLHTEILYFTRTFPFYKQL